ncbi:uncharacterized protein EAE98_002450 [Botrytis deweyae]|uniref:Uncharacterized protein n=1 Tax=Botrytis deweyae TaxID=2478750 RepID=A0ABQ7IX84_9HELO|nr:uncharacterized protein EAE98_002450 [Botrytis deweyae]KAF7936231.1 hypothetical protein EAE98_002450 [Botrytis deweyae]
MANLLPYSYTAMSHITSTNPQSSNCPAVTTNVTHKQRPRLQLMFPNDYTLPTAISGDQPCGIAIL